MRDGSIRAASTARNFTFYSLPLEVSHRWLGYIVTLNIYYSLKCIAWSQAVTFAVFVYSSIAKQKGGAGLKSTASRQLRKRNIMHFDSFAVLGELRSLGWLVFYLLFVLKNDMMTSVVCDVYAVILASRPAELPAAMSQQNIDTIFRWNVHFFPPPFTYIPD